MIDFLILVQPQNILDCRVTCPNEIVFFTGLKKLESSSFHCVDNCIVYVRTLRYQEGHVEILDVTSSLIALDETLVVRLGLVNVGWVWEEGCWRTAFEFRFEELHFVSAGLEYAVR